MFEPIQKAVIKLRTGGKARDGAVLITDDRIISVGNARTRVRITA